MMIARQTIDEVLDRVSITDVVSGVVQLKKQGSSLVGLCPFHSEKSPSFHVRETVGTYHCFGCGASGNAISFVMKSRGVSFPDAVTELAQRYNITIIHEGAERQRRSDDTAEKKALLFRIQALAQEYFVQQRTASTTPAEVAAYLKERKITDQSIETFGIGYAPKSWRGLTEYLLARKVPAELLLLSGLVKKNDRGELYDLFRGRLMFPIMLDRGRIVAFGGRMIPALHTQEERDSFAKYFNSPETLIYKKQEVLYGLEQAIQGLRSDKRAVIVEGYLDVIGLHQVGVTTAVATCGTAFTPKHVKRLSGLCKSVLVLFDGDTAGRNAAGKSFEVFLNGGVDTYAVFLPPEHDPDSFAAQYGEQTKTMLLSMQKKSLLDCYLEMKLTAEGSASFSELGAAAKGKIADQAVAIIGQVRNPVERADLLSKVASRLSIADTILAEMAPPPSSDPAMQDEDDATKEAVPVPQAASFKSPEELSSLDREIILALFAQKERFPEELLSDPQLCSRISREAVHFAQELLRIFGSSLQPSTESDLVKKEGVLRLLTTAGQGWKKIWKKAFEMSAAGADFTKVIEGCRKKVDRQALESEYMSLAQEMTMTPHDEDKLILAQRQLEIQKLLQSQ